MKIDHRAVAALHEQAAGLATSTAATAFADWKPHALTRPFPDDLADHFAARQKQPFALYERTDHFVHRMTGEATRRTTATVLHPSDRPIEGGSIELPFERWRDDIMELSPYNPRLDELLELTRQLPTVPLDDPNVRGVYLTMTHSPHHGTKLQLVDRELHMLVPGRGEYLARVPFTLQGPADVLAATRPFLHRDGAPADAMITRSNELLLAIRDRNGMTANLPATQRIAVSSNWADRR